jgi:hypothetical protein
MSKSIAIVQSNYVPWKGYFDLIRQVDEFVLYDDAQYTRRDWRNRNLIKTREGVRWLTIPVDVKGKYFQKIKDTKVSDPNWGRAHWQTVRHCYARAPFFCEYRDLVHDLYLQTQSEYLSEINHLWIVTLCRLLGIETRLGWSMSYTTTSDDPSTRLLEICLQAGATHYLSGPAARSYLNEDLFCRSGVTVRYMEYDGYPEYPQLYPPFAHGVSVLDLIFMVGARARDYICRNAHAA